MWAGLSDFNCASERAQEYKQGKDEELTRWDFIKFIACMAAQHRKTEQGSSKSQNRFKRPWETDAGGTGAIGPSPEIVKGSPEANLGSEAASAPRVYGPE